MNSHMFQVLGNSRGKSNEQVAEVDVSLEIMTPLTNPGEEPREILRTLIYGPR